MVEERGRFGRVGIPRKLLLFCVSVGTVIPSAACAQSTGTVGSPLVRPGTSLSVAGGAASDDGQQGYAHRIGYRRAIGKKTRVGAIMFYNDRGGDYRFRRLDLEAMHQFPTAGSRWTSALQIRGRIPDGNGDQMAMRIAWLNRWRSDDGRELRLIGLASREFGKARADGIALETRSEVSWRAGEHTRAGVQMFNRLNTTAAFGSFDEQRHSVGGVVKGSLSNTVSYRMNLLFGVSEAASDAEFRLRLRRRF